ncbi:MAG: hypothetical protein ACLFQR_11330 [Desulfovibrionales bacterium]
MKPPVHNHEKELRHLGYEPGLQDAFRVNILDIGMSKGALKSVVQGLDEIAEQYGKQPDDLHIQLFERIYWLQLSGNLVMVVDVDDLDSYVFIEIPREHWWFKERSFKTH